MVTPGVKSTSKVIKEFLHVKTVEVEEITVTAGMTDGMTAGMTAGTHTENNDRMHAMIGAKMRAAIGSMMFAMIDDKMQAMIGSRMSATIGAVMFAMIDDMMHAMIGSRMSATIGAVMFAMIDDKMHAMIGSRMCATIGAVMYTVIKARMHLTIGVGMCAGIDVRMTGCIRSRRGRRQRSGMPLSMFMEVLRHMPSWTAGASIGPDTVRARGPRRPARGPGYSVKIHPESSDVARSKRSTVSRRPVGAILPWDAASRDADVTSFAYFTTCRLSQKSKCAF